MLRDFNFDLDSNLYDRWENATIDEDWKKLSTPKGYDFLFPYQKDAMRYSKYFNDRILLTMSMGTGKSVTSLSIMDKRNQFPVVIVPPSTIKEGWKREYYKFINKDHRIKTIESSKEMIDYHGEYDIFIINYELLARNIDKVEEGKKIKFIPNDTLIEFKSNNVVFGILDEIHRIKNPESKTSNAIKYLLDSTCYILALTGTPILSSSKDVFMVLNLLYPDMFNSYYRFCNRFCHVKVYKGQRDFYGARNSSELNNLLVNNGMFRITKEQSGKVANKPLVSVLPLMMKEDTEYKRLEGLECDDFGAKLKKEAWNQKKEHFFSRLDDMLEESLDKFVIFAHNKIVIDDIMEKYPKISLKIDGSTSTKGATRQNLVDEFTASKTHRLFVVSIQAGGVGLDGLQYASSTVIFVQWSWVFADIDQAVSRIHRTGQKEQVTVYHFPAMDTIEEVFMDVLDKKAKISGKIVDNKDLSEKEMLGKILKISKKRAERRRNIGKI